MNLFKKLSEALKPTQPKHNAETIAKVFETEVKAHDEASVRKSQEKRILEYLLEGYTITQLEALQMFGCMRLSGRIFDLRNKGFNIEMTIVTTKKRKRVAQYKLQH